jgi:hypothetical protein
MITVQDLINHLKQLPPNIGVIYKAYSDFQELTLDELQIVEAVDKSNYVMRSHPTMSEENKQNKAKFLCFPGN